MKIIKIGAIWCPGCLIMRPRWKKIEEEFNIETNDYDYDIDEDIVKKFNVGKKLPVVIILDENDDEVERVVGEISSNKLRDLILKYIEK